MAAPTVVCLHYSNNNCTRLNFMVFSERFLGLNSFHEEKTVVVTALGDFIHLRFVNDPLIREEELLRQDIADFTISKKEDWVPIGCMPHPEEERVRLNVGGQVKT